MADADDMHWVQQVLSGEAPCGSSPNSLHRPRAQARATREQIPDQARASSASASDCRPRRFKNTRKISSNQVTNSATPRYAPSSSTSPPPSSVQQERNRNAAQHRDLAETKSSNGGKRCQLCRCWVWAGDSGWQTHIKGIAHRQQVLSLRETGELGHTFVSVFQSQPALQPHIEQPPFDPGQGWKPSPDLVHFVSTRLKLELLNYGNDRDRARWDNLASLSHGLSDLIRSLAEEVELHSSPCQQVRGSLPNAEGCTKANGDSADRIIATVTAQERHNCGSSGNSSSSFRAQRPGRCSEFIPGRLRLLCSPRRGTSYSMFALAVLPLAATEVGSPCAAISHLDIAVVGSGGEIQPLVCASIAALGHSLAHGLLPALEDLTITLKCLQGPDDYDAGGSPRRDQYVKAVYMATATLLRYSATAIATCTSSIRAITIDAREGIANMSRLRHAAEDFASTTRVRAIRQRTSLLMGYCRPREQRGGGCQLWMLDRDTMAVVMGLGAPLQPCILTIKAPCGPSLG